MPRTSLKTGETVKADNPNAIGVMLGSVFRRKDDDAACQRTAPTVRNATPGIVSDAISAASAASS